MTVLSLTGQKAKPKDGEPPREVWVVSSPSGPDFVASYREAAMEHAAELAGELPEHGPYRVCKYVAVPFVGAEFPRTGCSDRAACREAEFCMDGEKLCNSRQ